MNIKLLHFRRYVKINLDYMILYRKYLLHISIYITLTANMNLTIVLFLTNVSLAIVTLIMLSLFFILLN